MRYLGLDVGQKRIGVAIGEVIADELTTLEAAAGKNFYQEPGCSQAYLQIQGLVVREKTDAIVIGLPVDDQGKMTEEATKIKNFSEGLSKTLNTNVHFVNETLTSFMAKDILESQDLDQKEVEQRIDQLSASLILQQYIEEHALV